MTIRHTLIARPLIVWAAALACLGALAGCERQAAMDGDSAPVAGQTPVEQAPAAADGVNDTPISLEAPMLTPEAERGEAGARNVLLEWARALERGDYDRAYAQFGDAGAASGMSREDHASQWSQFRRITVSAPDGEMEGAAGSSYYRAQVAITALRPDGSTLSREGEVTLRRVNDVPGATPAQLRWHIISSELSPG